MARLRDILTDKAVKALKEPGMYHDGEGLYLRITPAGLKSWLYRFKVDGSQKHFGLGGYPDTSILKARDGAEKLRKQRKAGEAPVPVRERNRLAKEQAIAQEAERQLQAAAAAKAAITFETFAEEFIAAREAEWKNPKHRAQWLSTLKAYVYPKIGSKPVAQIDIDDVLAVVTPYWATKNETINRVRGRIEQILDAARVRKLRVGENPARLRGNLDALLAKRSKVLNREHHAAMAYDELPAFIGRLREQPGQAATALELAILTACRTSEVLNAVWEEFDLDVGVWVIPKERMKAHREHRVALSKQAVELLRRQPKAGVYVFPGRRPERPMSNMALLMVLRRMGLGDLTTHGFRSSFADWAAEQTSHPTMVVEAALAHVSGDKVERAYRRSDVLEKRRQLMDDWGSFCAPEAKFSP